MYVYALCLMFVFDSLYMMHKDEYIATSGDDFYKRGRFSELSHHAQYYACK